jgi:beta-glucosidase-like glycosyl hydrolase
MPRLDIHRFLKEPAYRERIRTAVSEAIAGGFCVFNGTTGDTKEVLAELQALSQQAVGEPLLFSCDCEWGLSMRLTGDATEFPHALALARSSYPDAVYKAAHTIGTEMKSLGIHWNYAPVADVNSNPDNPIINIRAFGDDPEQVSRSVIAYSEGLRDAGIISTAKHFPGHGETKIDSHSSMPVLDLPVSHFEEIELLPFSKAISSGIPSILTGHLAAPQLARALGASASEADLPATVSPYLTRKLLREQLGFTGVIVTDSLEMAAVRNIFPTEAELSVAAIRSGADIALMPIEFEKTYAYIAEQYHEDPEFAQIVIESSERVQFLYSYIQQDIPQAIDPQEDLAFAIAAGAISVSGEEKLLQNLKYYKIVCDDEMLQAKRKELLEGLLQGRLTPSESSSFEDVVTFILQRPRGKLLDEGAATRLQTPVERFVEKHSDTATNCIFLLGNPYLETKLATARCIVKSYSDSSPSIRAAVTFLLDHR